MPSVVWEHLERPERGKDNPVCRHCGKSVKNKGGNTSNLMAHIKTKLHGVQQLAKEKATFALARTKCSIFTSSSPSERLFSKAGQIVSSQRAQPKPEQANMLIFLAENL